MVNQNLAHEAGGDGVEVAPVFELWGGGAGEPEVDFVDQGGGLEGMARAFAPEGTHGEPVQLTVDKGDELFEGRCLAFTPLLEEDGDFPWILRRGKGGEGKRWFKGCGGRGGHRGLLNELAQTWRKTCHVVLKKIRGTGVGHE